ncbi:SRPBCC domain-containing protein [Haliea sp.]|uniref:SRPBCC domain-containing protein n=1 Tax=Haliea sp. TaxID=1932666 RepID=UPI003529175F
MFEILLTEEIQAPSEVVWEVITNTAAYPQWNTFVVACESTFQVGDPIHMKVRVLPFMVQPQTETIWRNEPGRLLDYGIKAPLGALASTRQHRLSATPSGGTHYESLFRLEGWFSPVVGLLFGAQLRRGFGEMTRGIANRAMDVNAAVRA